MTVRNPQEVLRRLPPPAVDAAVAVGVALVMTLIIGVAQEEESTRSPDLLAYLLGVVVGVLLLARRHHPLLVLVGSVGVLFIYYGLDYAAFSPAVPLAAAAYSAALAGCLLPAAAICAGTVVFGAGWQTVGEDESLGAVLGSDTLAEAALLAAVLLLGEAVRNRRAWAGEVRARLERARRDRELEAERRIQQERVRIARELHDVIAHTIAVITVQAGVASDSLDDASPEARAALQTIRQQSREATAELSATVGLLRGEAEDAPRAPAPGVAALDGLVEMAASAGLRVEVSVTGPARRLPASVDLTAYRIVQEALTNVMRHAHASCATIAVRYDPAGIDIEVDDDGAGAHNGATREGYGLLGMRERAAAFGGTLRAGPGPEGGFRVHARLPTPQRGA